MSHEITKEFMIHVKELLKLAHDRCELAEKLAERTADTVLKQHEVIDKLVEAVTVLKRKVLALEKEKLKHVQN